MTGRKVYQINEISFELRMESVLMFNDLRSFVMQLSERPEWDSNPDICDADLRVELSGKLGAGHYVGQDGGHHCGPPLCGLKYFSSKVMMMFTS